MMMFETSKHVPKTEKRCCVFENNRFICANKTIWKSLSVYKGTRVPVPVDEKLACASGF